MSQTSTSSDTVTPAPAPAAPAPAIPAPGASEHQPFAEPCATIAHDTAPWLGAGTTLALEARGTTPAAAVAAGVAVGQQSEPLVDQVCNWAAEQTNGFGGLLHAAPDPGFVGGGHIDGAGGDSGGGDAGGGDDPGHIDSDPGGM